MRKPNQPPTKKKSLPPPSTPTASSSRHSTPRVQIVDTPEVIELQSTSGESEDGYESSNLSDTPAPTPSHHPILSPLLSTPANPNRRLPDPPLEIRLRFRR